MPKTASPDTIEIVTGETFETNVLPDPFDERDLRYRPRLEPLPRVLDQLEGTAKPYVMRQQGNSCTGHALASVINAVLARQPQEGNGQTPTSYERVSPYMLYHLARRYDEFPGESDAGSSLRGALKGWLHHGVLLEEDWPELRMDVEPDVDCDECLYKAGERPLGAFYRVNPFRLDDVQSAINELGAICASAAVHDGWMKPAVVERGGEQMHVIARAVDAQPRGGHAFALVGYNEVGFLVQNSWGPEWGKGGFATLPYQDWLESAYDAWVVRPGVPRTPLAGGWSQTALGTGEKLMTGAGPDLRRLGMHVVNLGNNGRLSSTGRFASTPQQIGRAFEHMERWHEFWRQRQPQGKRHVLLYAHGGLTDENRALNAAQENLNWWLNNRVYPLFFAWQSGPEETLLNQLADLIGPRLPTALGFDLWEGADRLVESIARDRIRGLWDEMKENAKAASDPIPDRGAAPGASLVVDRLRQYMDKHGRDEVSVHLVGHSAGSIFHAALLRRLVGAGLPVASMALLAPAIRVDEFASDILPHIGKSVRRFTILNLSDQRELDDTCAAGGFDVYHKSVLYLVSRALERPSSRQRGDVPLLGMQRFFSQRLPGQQRSLQEAITAAGGTCIFSPHRSPDESRSDAVSHGGFAAEPLTMTSVVMRMLGNTKPAPENNYRRNAPLREAGPSGPVGIAAMAPEAAVAPPTPEAQTLSHDVTPLIETAERQHGQPLSPPQDSVPIEVADAPSSGASVLDLLRARGWTPVGKE